MLSVEKKAKLTWHCRRGMLELDLILQRFLTQAIDSLSNDKIIAFEQLLSAEDPDLYAWLMDYEEPSKELKEIVTLIQSYDNTKKIN